MTFTAKNGSPDLGMERDLVMLSAIVTNDIETLWRIVTCRGFFGSAFGATLRSHHIALVKHLLFLFGEQKDLFTLHTRNFYVRHR